MCPSGYAINDKICKKTDYRDPVRSVFCTSDTHVLKDDYCYLETETKDVKEDDGVQVKTHVDENAGVITISADVELEGTYTIIVNSNDKANNKNKKVKTENIV